MDVTLTCPKCSRQIVASDAAETVFCRQCNASLPVTPAASPKPALGLAKRQEDTPREAAPALAGTVAAHLGQIAETGEAPTRTRGIAEEDLPDSLREGLARKRDMEKAITRRKASLRWEQLQSAMVSAAVCTGLVGACVAGLVFGSAGTARSCTLALLAIGTCCGVGILFTSFMEGFRSFLLAGCLPIISNFLPLMWPLAGTVIAAFAFLYQVYFVFWESKSGLLKGAYIPCVVGVNWALARMILSGA